VVVVVVVVVSGVDLDLDSTLVAYCWYLYCCKSTTLTDKTGENQAML
jgi:hypothetical protein